MPAILVADDDQAIRRILTLTLELEGHQVIPVQDGQEALQAMSRTPLPDIAVLDVMMPKLNGLDVLQKIREDPRTHDVPVILLTAKKATEDVWEGWRRGVDYYMTKPFDVEELLAVIDKILNNPAPPDSEDDEV